MRIRVVCVGCVVGAAFGAFLLPAAAQEQRGNRAERAKGVAKAMTESKQSLAGAITAVESQSKGQAISARAMLQDKNLSISVDVIVGDEMKHFRVDEAGKIEEVNIRELLERARPPVEERPKGDGAPTEKPETP